MILNLAGRVNGTLYRILNDLDYIWMEDDCGWVDYKCYDVRFPRYDGSMIYDVEIKRIENLR